MEVYGSREVFIDLVMKVLDKTDELERMLSDVEANMKFSKNFMGVLGEELEEELEEEILANSQVPTEKSVLGVNDVLKQAIEMVEEADKVEFSKFIKIYTEKNGKRNVGVSHSRLNNLAKERKLPTISFPSNYKTCTKSFTNLTATTSTGRSNTGSAFCTLIPVSEVGEEVKLLILEKTGENPGVFGEEEEAAPENAQVEPDVVVSQDFPSLTQSVTGETMMVCDNCDFMSRSKNVFRKHEETHPACSDCGRRFISVEKLDEHKIEEHDFYICVTCKATVKTVDKERHSKMHEMLESHEAALTAGKTKGRSKSVTKERTVKPMNSWLIFCQEHRKEERQRNPNLTATDVTAILSIKWKALGKEGQKKYADKADEMKNATDQNRHESGVTLVSSVTPSVAAVPITEDQTRILQCPQCGSPFVTEESLGKHVEECHARGSDIMELDESINNNVESDETEEPSFKEGQVILVKQRVFEWPALIHHVNAEKETLTVQLYNPAKTIKKISMKSATMFYEMNEFKGNLPKGWKTGYLEALAVFKSAEME